MPRRKRRKDTSAQSAAALRRNGLLALKKLDYDKAIEAWERAYKQQSDKQLTAALAEAHFHRAIKSRAKPGFAPKAVLTDLQRAAQLRPDENRYAYHLALALHRQGETAQALTLYRQVRADAGPLARRAAYPLALALLQCNENPAKEPVWADLDEDKRGALRAGGALEKGALPNNISIFWRAVGVLRDGRHAEAEPLLRQVLSVPDNPQQQAFSHYALGFIAAAQEDWSATRKHWQTAYASGLSRASLQSALAELSHRQAEDLLTAGDLKGALAAAGEAANFYPEPPAALNELQAQIWQRQGYEAADKNDWDAALDCWQKARDLDGGSFRLAYNLALALEKQGEWAAAGEAWREALRRRPRRSDHPDAISEEQVSRLWQRAAEAYQKVGDFDEAIQVYRHAVKWNENNLDIRIALARSLMLNGQFRAAENEARRILDKNDNYIPALLLLGEALVAQESWRGYQAPRIWQKVLEIEPQNQQARHLLADFYADSAEAALSWDRMDHAIAHYESALKFLPDDPPVLAALGGCYLRNEDVETAETYFNKALLLAPGNLEVYEKIICAWLDIEEEEEARQAAAQMETAVPHIPYQFFMKIAGHCIESDLDQFISFWLERAAAVAPPSENIFLRIGEMLTLFGSSDLAREYLEKGIAANQEPGECYFSLGMLAMREGKRDEAEKHWRQAERIARKTKNRELLGRVEEARVILKSPLARLFSLLQGGGPPDDVEGLLSAILEDDFDFEDEDGYDRRFF